MANPVAKTCLNCSFAFMLLNDAGDIVKMECRRRTPQVFAQAMPTQRVAGGNVEVNWNLISAWPPTQAHFWCAEHEMSEAPPPRKESGLKLVPS